MKQFKNKFTGDVATLTNETGYKLNSEIVGLIPAQYIENSNDWEEVKQEVQENYQVLSFREKSSNSIITLRGKGTYIIDTAKDWEYPGFSFNKQMEYVRRGGYEIYSIKRISDGEIFTIGDKLKVPIGKGETRTIERISLMKEDVAWLGWRNGASNLRTAKKVEVLFTSCDGVEIFSGQSWWYVAHSKMVARQTDTLVYRGTNESDVSRFSTREKAEMWIRNNRKPNLVTEDGVKIFPGDKYWSVNLKTLSMWEATCNNSTHKNGNIKVFSNESKAEKYQMFNAPVLSLNDVAKIYVSANREVTALTAMSAQNRRIQKLVLDKLTNYGNDKN